MRLEEKKKTALVTGGAGFIGSHMADALLAASYAVRVLDDFLSGSKKNIEHLFNDPDFLLYEGSITDASLIEEAVQNVDVVFHFAALVSVPLSIERPKECFETNVTAFNDLLLALREKKTPVIYISSAAVYGNRSEDMRSESETPLPTSPYGASKAINEIQAIAASHAWGIPTLGCRFFNVYGPRQNPTGAYASVIPQFCKKLIEGEPLTVFGDGEQTRDFIYVEDIVNILMRLLPQISGDSPRVLNIGTGQSVSVNQVLEEIKKTTHLDFTERREAVRAGDIKHSNADISALRGIIGDYPCTGLREGLSKTYGWYRNAGCG